MPSSPELDDVLRIRCEKELKPRLKAIARRHKRKTANLARAVLWEYVMAEEAEFAPDRGRGVLSRKKKRHLTEEEGN